MTINPPSPTGRGWLRTALAEVRNAFFTILSASVKRETHGLNLPWYIKQIDKALSVPARDVAESVARPFAVCNSCPNAYPCEGHQKCLAPPKPAPDAMREALSALEPFTKLGGGQNPRDAAAGLHYAAYYDLPGDTVVYENGGACITADDVRTARRVYKAHSIPMPTNWTAANDLVKSIVSGPRTRPPADGAGEKMSFDELTRISEKADYIEAHADEGGTGSAANLQEMVGYIRRLASFADDVLQGFIRSPSGTGAGERHG